MSHLEYGNSSEAPPELVRFIDTGAFAEVWEGRTAAGEAVAVKVFLEEELEYAEQQAQEHCMALARIQEHAVVVPRSITRVLHRKRGQVVALVTDLVEGVPLQKNKRLDKHFAERIVRQVAAALVSLHREGLEHGDLKRENVLITATGAVLIDVFYNSSLVTREAARFRSDIKQFEEFARQVFDQVPDMDLATIEQSIGEVVSNAGLIRPEDDEPIGASKLRTAVLRESDDVYLVLVDSLVNDSIETRPLPLLRTCHGYLSPSLNYDYVRTVRFDCMPALDKVETGNLSRISGIPRLCLGDRTEHFPLPVAPPIDQARDGALTVHHWLDSVVGPFLFVRTHSRVFARAGAHHEWWNELTVVDLDRWESVDWRSWLSAGYVVGEQERDRMLPRFDTDDPLDVSDMELVSVTPRYTRDGNLEMALVFAVGASFAASLNGGDDGSAWRSYTLSRETRSAHVPDVLQPWRHLPERLWSIHGEVQVRGWQSCPAADWTEAPRLSIWGGASRTEA